MARRGTGVLVNENGEIVMPLLDYVGRLKVGYQSAPDEIEACDAMVIKIVGLLRSQTVRDTLQAMLDERPRAPLPLVPLGDSRLEWEAELGDYFGYSANEVKRYVKKA